MQVDRELFKLIVIFPGINAISFCIWKQSHGSGILGNIKFLLNVFGF